MTTELISEVAEIPEEFSKIIKDFVKDIKVTFPEYTPLIHKWWNDTDSFQYIEDEEERKKLHKESEEKSIQLLFDFCKIKMPPRIFDIIYQNEDMFKETSEIDTEFLPKIHFKNLWQCDITDKTRATIWKYLQLITFSIIGTLNNKDAFGDTAKILENIDQDEFKEKIAETMEHVHELFNSNRFFENSEAKSSDTLEDSVENEEENESTKSNTNMPNAEKIHSHISSMLDGKLGKLAKEIAEETASNMNDDFADVTNMQDIFQKMLKDPSKMMGLVKSVGEKLDTRIKSGEIKESEIFSEATNLMNGMKNMPGMENIQSMLNKMGMNSFGGKVNTAAMEAQLNNRMKMAKTKERIKKKAELNAATKLMQQYAEQQRQQSILQQNTISDDELIKMFNEKEPKNMSQQIEKTARKNGKKHNNK